MKPSESSTATHQSEIDGLRGVAVLAVVFNHFFGGILTSGYLGVDIFYVISGYVITGYLSRVKAHGWQDYLISFYSKRVKRLLPALLVCVTITNIAFLIFVPTPSKEIFHTGYLALVGLSNLFLLFTSNDYFSLDAKLNPFTQTWSLSVEEQFYLIFPILLGALGYAGNLSRVSTTWTLRTLIYLTALSFGAYLLTHLISSPAAFYLMPMRFWELSAGSIIYIVTRNFQETKVRGLSLFFLTSISLLFFIPLQFQVLSTTICVLLTAGLLLTTRRGDVAYAILSSRPLTHIGFISYSLYLWHWSVLTLGRWTIGDSTAAKFVLLPLAFAFAFASYYFVEKPLRHKTWKKGPQFTPIALGAFAVALSITGFSWAKTTYLSNYNAILTSIYNIPATPDWGQEVECHGRIKVKEYENPFEYCLGSQRSPERPHILYLIGDSHAAQLVFMSKTALQNTSYALKFINTEDGDDFPRSFLDSDMAKARTVEYIIENSKSGDIVMISFHRGHLNDSRDEHIPLDQYIEPNNKVGNFYRNAENAFQRLAQKGVNILLVKDTPLMASTTKSSACLLQIKAFGQSICRVNKEQDLHTRVRQDSLFEELKKKLPNVQVWDPLPLIYGQNDSLDVVDASGSYVMMDWHHITEYESKKLSVAFFSFFQNLSTQQ